LVLMLVLVLVLTLIFFISSCGRNSVFLLPIKSRREHKARHKPTVEEVESWDESGREEGVEGEEGGFCSF
jgi:hypothetical protein